MNEQRLSEIHARALAAYQAGCRDVENILDLEDCNFLKSIGLRPGIVYDYVEDFSRRGQPTLEDFLQVCKIRYSYFHDMQKECWEDRCVPESELPLRETELEGIPWLPRIIQKAQCFLTGTLCPEVMYGCRGDLRFLNEHDLNVTDFLIAVRDSNADPTQILQFVRSGGCKI